MIFILIIFFFGFCLYEYHVDSITTQCFVFSLFLFLMLRGIVIYSKSLKLSSKIYDKKGCFIVSF